MDHDGIGRADLVTFEGRAVPVRSGPARLEAAVRALAGVRRAPVARIATAGPVLRASALAVVAAVLGRGGGSVAGAGRPAPPQPAAPGPQPSAGGAVVRVTWTTVEIRWTER